MLSCRKRPLGCRLRLWTTPGPFAAGQNERSTANPTSAQKETAPAQGRLGPVWAGEHSIEGRTPQLTASGGSHATKPKAHFGYFSSGADFSAPVVVFIALS